MSDDNEHSPCLSSSRSESPHRGGKWKHEKFSLIGKQKWPAGSHNRKRERYAERYLKFQTGGSGEGESSNLLMKEFRGDSGSASSNNAKQDSLDSDSGSTGGLKDNSLSGAGPIVRGLFQFRNKSKKAWPHAAIDFGNAGPSEPHSHVINGHAELSEVFGSSTKSSRETTPSINRSILNKQRPTRGHLRIDLGKNTPSQSPLRPQSAATGSVELFSSRSQHKANSLHNFKVDDVTHIEPLHSDQQDEHHLIAFRAGLLQTSPNDQKVSTTQQNHSTPPILVATPSVEFNSFKQGNPQFASVSFSRRRDPEPASRNDSPSKKGPPVAPKPNTTIVSATIECHNPLDYSESPSPPLPPPPSFSYPVGSPVSLDQCTLISSPPPTASSSSNTIVNQSGVSISQQGFVGSATETHIYSQGASDCFRTHSVLSTIESVDISPQAENIVLTNGYLPSSNEMPDVASISSPFRVTNALSPTSDHSVNITTTSSSSNQTTMYNGYHHTPNHVAHRLEEGLHIGTLSSSASNVRTPHKSTIEKSAPEVGRDSPCCSRDTTLVGTMPVSDRNGPIGHRNDPQRGGITTAEAKKQIETFTRLRNRVCTSYRIQLPILRNPVDACRLSDDLIAVADYDNGFFIVDAFGEVIVHKSSTMEKSACGVAYSTTAMQLYVLVFKEGLWAVNVYDRNYILVESIKCPTEAHIESWALRKITIGTHYGLHLMASGEATVAIWLYEFNQAYHESQRSSAGSSSRGGGGSGSAGGSVGDGSESGLGGGSLTTGVGIDAISADSGPSLASGPLPFSYSGIASVPNTSNAGSHESPAGVMMSGGTGAASSATDPLTEGLTFGQVYPGMPSQMGPWKVLTIENSRKGGYNDLSVKLNEETGETLLLLCDLRKSMLSTVVLGNQQTLVDQRSIRVRRVKGQEWIVQGPNLAVLDEQADIIVYDGSGKLFLFDGESFICKKIIADIGRGEVSSIFVHHGWVYVLCRYRLCIEVFMYKEFSETCL